ncbi:hypothetical protein [Gulosibacter sediminis]|uniref:hypothetical protein n=1 Tax=Gulosibacter sediminis TaxID=1729695 RepID=UPI0024A8826F|nr:hypothetical protein [Gulosibacter sediminis]
MDNTTQNGATLTRRQAREIERRTGVRPMANAEPGSSFHREDTGRIERNEMTALISVLPTELINQLSEPAAEAEAPRGLTVRAARPAALIAQRRRRTAGGFAAAASVTALAAVGLTTVAGQGAVVADTQHQADLLSAVNSQVTGATADAATQAAEDKKAEEAAAQEQSAPAAESTEATEIESFDSATVASAAVAVPTEEPEETTTATDASSSSTEASSSDSTGSSSSASTPAPAPATGNVQQVMLNYLQSMLGSYGMDCTDYAQNALAAAGLTTARLDGGYDYGIGDFTQFGTQIDPSQAQAGDIMIKYGYHVSVYAGGGQAYHGGWNGAANDNVLTSYQGDPYFYDVIIRVNG